MVRRNYKLVCGVCRPFWPPSCLLTTMPPPSPWRDGQKRGLAEGMGRFAKCYGQPCFIRVGGIEPSHFVELLLSRAALLKNKWFILHETAGGRLAERVISQRPFCKKVFSFCCIFEHGPKLEPMLWTGIIMEIPPSIPTYFISKVLDDFLSAPMSLQNGLLMPINWFTGWIIFQALRW